MTKICSKCATEKAFTEFYRAPKGFLGLRTECKDCNRKASLENYHKKPDKIQWQAKDPERARVYRRAWQAKHRIENLNYRIVMNVRCRIWKALRGVAKSKNTEELMGGIELAKSHLESKFLPGWSWGNYGEVWEIDHIKPLSKFDLRDPEQQKSAFHFSNTQPLPVADNRIKGARY